MGKKLAALVVVLLLLTSATITYFAEEALVSEGPRPLIDSGESGPEYYEDGGTQDAAPTFMPYEYIYGDAEPDLDIKEKAIELIFNSLEASGHQTFVAHVSVSNSTVRGLAYLTEDVFESGTGAAIACGFVSTDGNVAYELTEIIPEEQKFVVDGYIYVWTETVGIEPMQFIYEDRHCTLRVTDSIMTIGYQMLDAGYFDPDVSDSEYNLALKRAYNPEIHSMYSYDSDKWIVREQGAYNPIEVSPLYLNIDHSQMKIELERIMNNQRCNYSTSDYVSVFTVCLDAIKTYLSKTSGSIDSYSIVGLEEYSKSLEYNQILTVGMDRAYVYSLIPQTDLASTEERWTYGVLCGIVAIISLALIIALPGLGLGASGALIGAIAGACLSVSIEVVNEVSIKGMSPQDLGWQKLLISALVGAACAPLMSGASAFIAGGIAGGIESAAFSIVDDASLSDTLLAAVIGTTMGLAIGGIVNNLGPILKITSTHRFAGDSLKVKAGVFRNVDSQKAMSLKAAYQVEKGIPAASTQEQLAAEKASSLTKADPRYRSASVNFLDDDTVVLHGVSHGLDDVRIVRFTSKEDASLFKQYLDEGLLIEKYVPQNNDVSILLKNTQYDPHGEFIEHITFYPVSGSYHIHYRNVGFENGEVDCREIYKTSKNYSLRTTHSSDQVDPVTDKKVYNRIFYENERVEIIKSVWVEKGGWDPYYTWGKVAS